MRAVTFAAAQTKSRQIAFGAGVCGKLGFAVAMSFGIATGRTGWSMASFIVLDTAQAAIIAYSLHQSKYKSI